MSPTLEERVAKLEGEVQGLKTQTANGSPPHPLAEVAGIGANDPRFDEWREAIAQRRREIDADPNVP